MAVLAIAVLAFLCAFPAYFAKDIGVGAGFVAYAAVTSIATIGLYIAYAIPIYLRLRMGDALGAGRMEPRPALQVDRDRSPCIWVGVHLDPVHHADHADRNPVEGRLHVADLQLRADRGRRDAAARRRLVAPLGAASGSRARSSQGTPEELARIEAQYEHGAAAAAAPTSA